MADIFVEAGAGGNGCKLLWTLDFNDTADTVAITATHTHFDGSPAPDPQQAQISLELNSSVAITVNLLTGRLGTGQAFDGTATKIVNSGTRTRTGVRLKVSANRAALISFSTQYQPPA